MKLTWNQQRALDNLSSLESATPHDIADVFCGMHPYLCGAAARSALVALWQKDLVERIPTYPIRYRITASGRAALKPEGEQT